MDPHSKNTTLTPDPSSWLRQMLQKQAGLLALICQQRIKRKKHLHICRNEHKKMWIWYIKHSRRLCATNQRKHKQIKLKIFILIANSLSNIYIFYRSFLFFSMIISNISSFFSLYLRPTLLFDTISYFSVSSSKSHLTRFHTLPSYFKGARKYRENKHQHSKIYTVKQRICTLYNYFYIIFIH